MRLPALALCVLSAACSSAPRAHSPAPSHAPVVYQVFSRSFADGNGDGVADLDGITQHLDHVQHVLGADALWLTPIHPSPSPHGYDVTDYDAVHADLGGMDAWNRLITSAHARGMQVIMDLVLNHTAATHPWFTEPSRRDWYTWRTDDPGWRAPWPGGGRTWHPRDGQFFYGLFWEGMPDLNWNTPAVEGEMTAVALRWLQRGADGFRVDAARYLVESPDGTLADLPATHAIQRRMHGAVKKAAPHAWMVAEAWTERAQASGYALSRGGGFDRVFDFDLAGAIVASLNGEKVEPLRNALKAAERDWAFGATFIGNHDFQRLHTRLFGNDAAVRAAFTALLTLPGRPFIYAGDEAALAQADVEGDPGQRQAMPWDVVEKQRADGESLLAHVHRLLTLRRTHRDLQEDGPITLLNSDDTVAWMRGARAVRWVTVLNPGTQAVDVTLNTRCTSAMLVVGTSAARCEGETLQVSGVAASSAVVVEVR